MRDSGIGGIQLLVRQLTQIVATIECHLFTGPRLAEFAFDKRP